ncbi:hypothetical protein PSH79_02725 [Pseudomonas sp. FP2196]|uniref:hypothetical protein n=1 Tax=Pseudomonas sp. FP2196 TaxID=2954086 RepID=UPI002735BC53|nr:hypothetical protein [Pseudomonas sp. FP2196]WLH36221.1 hypothetical protein PSH79_02725 [Pseudomonas sp. FP2196]
MSPKLPAKGSVTRGAHTRHAPSADSDTQQPAMPPRVDAGPSSTPTRQDAPGSSRTQSEPPHEGVTPPPATTHSIPSASGGASSSGQRSLEHYWIPVEVSLPDVDALGFRSLRARRYVDVPGGHRVQVVIDPTMGLYRAKSMSERLLGPVLVRDHDSKLWHPLEESPGSLPLRTIEAINQEMDTHIVSITEAVKLTNEQRSAWHALAGQEGEKNALVRFEIQSQKQLATLEKAVNFYVTNQASLLLYKGRFSYETELVGVQKRQVEVYIDVLEAGDLRKSIDISSFLGRPLEAHRSMAGYLKGKLANLRKCQLIVDDILSRSPHLKVELVELGYDPVKIHTDTANWIYAKSYLLASEPVPDAAQFIVLSRAFSETTRTFGNIESIPEGARIPVLSCLIDQCAAIRASYEEMPLPSASVPDTSRREITDAIEAFENTLEQRIELYHQDLERTLSLPSQDQPIDFDFIPAQVTTQSAQPSRKMFRSKHHGVYKIRTGQSRRTAHGEEVIDVMDPHNPTEVLQTYERREGEWHRKVEIQEKQLSTLTVQAQRLLELSDSHLNKARQDETAKRNATNIVEFLQGKAEDLDELRQQIERAPNPATIDIAPLVQRLEHDSGRLRNEGEKIRIALYKDTSFLSVDRVAYLLSQGHLSVSKVNQTRLERGKGQDKYFLDIYSLNDKHTTEPLWHVHFKYEKKDSAALNFMVKGGHLKTVEQSSLGITSQRRDAQAGREHVPIWRATIDGKTAQKIFDLAAKTLERDALTDTPR